MMRWRRGTDQHTAEMGDPIKPSSSGGNYAAVALRSDQRVGEPVAGDQDEDCGEGAETWA